MATSLPDFSTIGGINLTNYIFLPPPPVPPTLPSEPSPKRARIDDFEPFATPSNNPLEERHVAIINEVKDDQKRRQDQILEMQTAREKTEKLEGENKLLRKNLADTRDNHDVKVKQDQRLYSELKRAYMEYKIIADKRASDLQTEVENLKEENRKFQFEKLTGQLRTFTPEKEQRREKTEQSEPEMNIKLRACQERKEALEKQNSKLRRELNECCSEKGDLVLQTADLRAAEKEAKDEAETLRNKCSTYKQRYKKWKPIEKILAARGKDEVTDFIERIKSLSKDSMHPSEKDEDHNSLASGDTQMQLKELQSELSQTNEKLSSVTQDQQVLLSENERLANELETYKRQLKDAARHQQSISENKKLVEEKLTKFADRLLQIENQLTESSRHCDSLEKEIRDKSELLCCKTAEVASLEMQLEKKIENYEKQKQEMRRQKEEMQRKLNDFQLKLSAGETELSKAISIQSEKLTEEIGEKDEKLKNKTAENENLQKKLSRIEMEQSQLIKRCDNITAESLSLQRENKEIKDRNRKLVAGQMDAEKIIRDELEAESSKVNQLQVTCDLTKHQLSSEEQRCASLQQQLDNCEQKPSTTSNCDGQVQQLKEEQQQTEHNFFVHLQTKDDAISRLQQQLAEVQERLGLIQAAVAISMPNDS